MKLEESVAHIRYIDLKPGMKVRIGQEYWAVSKKYKDDFRIYIKKNNKVTVRLSGGEENTHHDINPNSVRVWENWDDQIRIDRYLGLPDTDWLEATKGKPLDT